MLIIIFHIYIKLSTSGKYQCHITLFNKDPKTGENRRVTFSCDKICDTEQEAKQYCKKMKK